ncbi:dTDP-4-dehydrorhamnose reductase [Neoroseomonas terrae]|nr:dTDP-4-dehydrorhamnose reductase [Neoroseomonas terrae]
MRRILVTGQGGQLAAALATALPPRGFEAITTGRPAFDFDAPASVGAAVATARPDAVVNCAAWTAVDAAEDNEPAAFRANALGPGLVAAACAASGIPLIQISTDYVFDGAKGAPYVESDSPNPLSAYGRTKLAGEWSALAGNPQTLVLRTAWVYAAAGHNFLRTMLRLGAERPELRVVADQHGAPTAAPDLADAIAAILSRIRYDGWHDSHRGVFHATGSGTTTWHGFAEAIFGSTGLHPVLTAITTADFPTRACRPADGRLDCSRLDRTFGIRLPPWREGLARVLHARLAA